MPNEIVEDSPPDGPAKTINVRLAEPRDAAMKIAQERVRKAMKCLI